MDAREDRAVWDAWYPIGSPVDIRRHNRTATTLLGRRLDITTYRTWISASVDGEALPVTERLGLVWTTLGRPNRAPEPLIEYYEVDRSTLNVSTPVIACSGLQLISSVIDSAGAGLLVRDLQPGVANGSLDDEGAFSRPHSGFVVPLNQAGQFRMTTSHPFSALLALDRPNQGGVVRRYEFFAVYCQPVDETSTIAHALVAMVDPDPDGFGALAEHLSSTLAELKRDLESETASRALATPYGDWLSQKAIRYGANA